MCLVAFQKIFRKIFSGVWKRRRKTQIQKNTSHNPEKNHQRRQIQSDNRVVDRDLAFFARSRSTASRDRDLREITIDGAISQSVDRDLGSSSLAYIRDLAIDASRDRAVDRDLDPARSREGEIAINGAISRRQDRVRRFSSRARARALSLSLSLIFRKCFEGKIEVKMISVVKGIFFWSTDFNFRKIEFSEPTKQPHFRKSISGSDFHPKQTQPKSEER